MTSIENVSLLEILPESIKNDEKIYALAKTLDSELQNLSRQSKIPLHLPRLDELNHEILNELAYQYHLDFFEPERMTLEVKRKLIANAILQHKKYGTKFAVEKLLNTLSRGAKISEWFNYDGIPYHFKVNLRGLKDLDDDGERIMRAIEITKSVRDWIDDFDFDLSCEHPDEILHVGILQLFLGKILYELCTEISDKQKIFLNIKEVFSGNIFYTDEMIWRRNYNFCGGVINLTHGKIKYDAETEFEDDLWYKIWLNWIRSKWKKWRPADIFFDSESKDDEEPEEEILNQDFLKLWLDFHNSDYIRAIRIYYPRDNLTGEDINAVNIDNFFVYRKKYLSNKIIRAVYVEKSTVKLYF